MALLKGGFSQMDLAQFLGLPSKQSMSNKFSRGSWSASELAKVVEFTGGRLAFVYPDGQQILIFPESAPKLKGKAGAKEQE